MKADRAWWGTLLVAVLAVAFFGCRPASREEAREQAEEAGEEIKEAGREVGEAAEKGAEKAGEALEDVGEKLKAGKQTLDVKAALMADPDIDASNIDVDTEEATKTVVLKGTVPTAAQKAAAERIAKQKAEGYSVANRLTVAPKR